MVIIRWKTFLKNTYDRQKIKGLLERDDAILETMKPNFLPFTKFLKMVDVIYDVYVKIMEMKTFCSLPVFLSFHGV